MIFFIFIYIFQNVQYKTKLVPGDGGKMVSKKINYLNSKWKEILDLVDSGVLISSLNKSKLPWWWDTNH